MEKVQSILQKWRDKIRTGSEFEINLKELERNVGFLVQISVAFQSMKPFLRGFYLTSNSWREDRSSEGCKMPWRVYRVFMSLGRKAGFGEDESH